ncbi:MAG: hypothetical protein M3Y50_11965 [Acidobacteriota bacterium]|nr:hypothetical protein [Acidobacteriota bacterium]
MTLGMTLAALLHFAEALLWCALLFVSIAGYGAALLSLFRFRRPSLALASLSGFAVVLFLGGCLNLLRAVRTPVLLGMVLVGVVAAIVLRVSFTGTDEAGAGGDVAGGALAGGDAEFVPARPAHSSRAVKALLVLVALIFVVRVAASVRAGQYQASDDYNYYLGAPVKMLQLHHLAADPFSERRVTSSIGGNDFLQTLVLVALPIENLQMADRTLGLFLLALLAYGLAGAFRLTPGQRAVFAFLVLFTPQVQFNLTFVLLPSALFFGMVYLAAKRDVFPADDRLFALVLGGVTGAVSTLKSTYLVHGVIFVVALVLLRSRRSDFRSSARTFLFAVLGAFVVMAPWMMANRIASGTYFFPTLGRGYHYSAYGLYAAPSGAGVSVILHKVIPFATPLFLLMVMEWLFLGRVGSAVGDRVEGKIEGRPEGGSKGRGPQDDAILALSAAAFVAAILVGIATGGDSVRRYNYPCMLPAIVLLYVAFCRRGNASGQVRSWRLLQVGSVALTVAAAISIWGNRLSNEFQQIPESLKLALHDAPIVSPEVKAEYAAMEGSMPVGASALTSVGDSFLLDFRARDYKIADFPGGASLPPGWPSRQDGEGLARYLLANHLRFLIYDYESMGGLDALAPGVLRDASRTQWVHSEYAITLRSHQQFAELAGSRRRVYDDGRMYVLDLGAPASAGAAAGASSGTSARAATGGSSKSAQNNP